MKTIAHVALLVFALASVSVANCSEPRRAKPAATPKRFDYPRSAWPEFVAVRIPTVVRIWEDGKDVGTVGLRKGVVLKVLGLDKDGILEVEFAGARCFVDHAATDFAAKLK